MSYAAAVVKKVRGSLEVAGKTFTFEAGTEGELEAYTAASAYLDQQHQERIVEIAPKPGSRRLLPRDYEKVPTAVSASREPDPAEQAIAGEVLTPAPARLKKKGK